MVTDPRFCCAVVLSAGVLSAGVLSAGALSSSAFGQTGTAAPQTPPAGQSPYRLAATLPARIVRFTVEPESIRAGDTITLRWAVENPRTTAIDHGVGAVTPIGSRQMAPAVTTTYTLTVTGPNGAETRTVTVNVGGKARAVASHPDSPAASKAKPTRMLGGKPDFSGVYGAVSAAARGVTPPPTLEPDAERFRVVRGPTDAGLTSDCMPLGVPGSFNVPYPFQIVQTPQLLIIFYEYPNTFRIIPIDGRPHPDDPDPTWMGNSVGRWEGDILIVDSVGFNEKTEVGGFHHSEALHVVERFKRASGETLSYDVTIEDPNVFAAPWVWPTRTFTIRPEVEKIDEFVCENNRDYRPLFGKP